MRLKVLHKTRYKYSSSVFFEPHYFRFKPKITTYLELENFKIKVSPKPVGCFELVDEEGNRSFLYWFEEAHSELKIEVESIVQISDFNPFDFLVYPAEFNYLPFQYNDHTQKTLATSLIYRKLTGEMIDYLNTIKSEINKSIQFIGELTRRIHKDFTIEEREEGNTLEPFITFNKKKGACRDLAWMQIHMLRYLGIASKFVSGYLFFQTKEQDYELHAWGEAYIPGAGWIGFDPSHGIYVNSTHIPVSSSAYYENTMPVTGAVRGDGISELFTELFIREV